MMANGLFCQETLATTPNYKLNKTSKNNHTTSTGVKTDISPTTYLTDLSSILLHEDITSTQVHTSSNNDLICHEQLASVTRQLNSSSNVDLMCHEAVTSLSPAGGCEVKRVRPAEQLHHPPVKADCDTILLKDNRVLQNLLKSEDR